ncbi:D123-domain-containing protein [Sphaerosporella brunnea]|uniref:D123-domain-containing protein n=1 Tax=Sphaerosporella brunnea TaxID=1250544 RepID=A0A5J5F0R9_9PEZI|nr:D123-domain-containing protein [Sphaerosporella brunnea]
MASTTAEPHTEEPPIAMSTATTLRDIFPPVKKSHILNCSYPKWHSNYRSLTPKTRIVPLTPEFLDYLRADGIVLPADEEQITSLSDSESDEEGEEETREPDSDEEGGVAAPAPLEPTKAFPELHQKIKDTIAELGGRVAPKLNWSAPQDALFMTASNTLECQTPGEIYLLLKSSDFITHDLDHAFDDCVDSHEDDSQQISQSDIPYALVLRKWFQLNPSMEFRCFVRGRRLIAVSQRELNHFEFLEPMKKELLFCIHEFFDENLKYTFPDDSFVFDVYIPLTEADKRKTWLIDINPFAPRTDSLLFSWTELLELPYGDDEEEDDERRAPVELRLIKKGDPEAYAFASPQYSTSKLPQEVVQAGLQGDEAIWEFAQRWKDIMARMEGEKEKQKAAGTAST